MTAKSDFSNLGASLSSIQQNALDDQIANNSSMQSYNNITAQLKASIPSGFGEATFGAYELLGQGKDLFSRFSKVVSDVKKAPQAVKDALVKGKNNLGASLEEGKNVVTGGVADLQQVGTEALQTAKDITNTALNVTINSEGRFVTPSGRVAPPPPSERDLNQNLPEAPAQQSSQDILNSLTPEENRMSPSDVYDRLFGTQNVPDLRVPDLPVPEVPRFSLPLATKRPTTSGLADTMAPENVRQTALRAIDPEETIGPAFATNLQSFPGMPYLTGVDIPGVSSTAGDFLRGLTPASLVTRPDEAILPAGRSALSTTVTGLQEEASSGITNLLATGGGVKEAVATTLSNTVDRGSALASDLITTGSNTATKVTSTLSDLATAGTDLAKGVGATVAETGAEVASTFLPIVGEVTAVGLGAVQVYEGFKDLFDHPSASKPISVPMPQITNIAQGFQSGI